MARILFTALLALALCVVAAPAAHARTCADYPNQAAAQRAHDTRDADGDGVYCEALPCPCLAPGHAPRPHALHHRAIVGPSTALHRVTRSSGCRTRRGLPDSGCTPGARFANATRAEVCRPGYTRAVRDVSSSTKAQVYAEYGMMRRFNGRDGEVDHLISLELGGSNSIANLFPEAAAPRPGSHDKDRLENALHADVCSGRTSLARAQRLIAGDWVAVYRARFG